MCLFGGSIRFFHIQQSMYQREAMWMSFKPRNNPFQVDNGSLPSFAVKISVGGVNALTGLSQSERATGKQDYLAVGGKNGQLWVFLKRLSKYMDLMSSIETDGLYVCDIFCTILLTDVSLQQDGISTAPGVVRRTLN